MERSCAHVQCGVVGRVLVCLTIRGSGCSCSPMVCSCAQVHSSRAQYLCSGRGWFVCLFDRCLCVGVFVFVEFMVFGVRNSCGRAHQFLP